MGFGAILAGGAAASLAGGFLGGRAQDRAAALAQRAFAPSAEERAAMRASFAAERRDIVRREAELVELSRAMIQSGRNLGDLLAGQEASVLGPLRGQIERDRAALRSQLRERLGAGFETSTAGSQALNEFERQSQLTLEQAQQASIGQMSGIAQGARRGVIDPNFANLLNASLGQRSAAADIAALSERGNLARANMISGLGRSAFQAGTLASIFGGGGSATTPTGTEPQFTSRSGTSPFPTAGSGAGTAGPVGSTLNRNI